MLAASAGAKPAADAPLPKGLRAEIRVRLGAMARSATAAYEREVVDASMLVPGAPMVAPVHHLCGSALPVPAEVPRGVAHDPRPADFESGSPTEGWRCLKFAISEPFRCQYVYRAGSGYKGPKRGYPDPGPQGFEVSAECDVSGEGRTQLVTRTGVVKDGSVVISTSFAGMRDD